MVTRFMMITRKHTDIRNPGGETKKPMVMRTNMGMKIHDGSRIGEDQMLMRSGSPEAMNTTISMGAIRVSGSAMKSLIQIISEAVATAGNLTIISTGSMMTNGSGLGRIILMIDRTVMMTNGHLIIAMSLIISMVAVKTAGSVVVEMIASRRTTMSTSGSLREVMIISISMAMTNSNPKIMTIMIKSEDMIIAVGRKIRVKIAGFGNLGKTIVAAAAAVRRRKEAKSTRPGQVQGKTIVAVAIITRMREASVAGILGKMIEVAAALMRGRSISVTGVGTVPGARRLGEMTTIGKVKSLWC
jgi:hypothetical protein